MASKLQVKYPRDFLALWDHYPLWPKGRSVKKKAAENLVKIKKALGLSESDVCCDFGDVKCSVADPQCLVCHVEKQKRERESWQAGSAYGPQGLQVWLNQYGWEHDYPTKKRPTLRKNFETEWERRGMTRPEWEAEQDWIARSKLGMQQRHESLEAAMAAARREEQHGSRH